MNTLSSGRLSEAKYASNNIYRPFAYKAVANMQHIKRLLINAIDHDEFDLVYQPQTDMSGHKVIGVEALLRWHSAEYGVISPAEFIPVAEKLNLITEIGELVIKSATAQLAEWKIAYQSDIRMAINVSYMQVHSHKIIETFDECITKYNLNAAELEIELTESSLVKDKDYVIKILEEIREMGIRTAIDDFGTGYSSLSHLADMPFDMLKIDKSFITQIGINKASSTITQSIIDMAKNLDMEVLAEGVETQHQHDFLKNNKCDLLQGNLISQPIGADKIPGIVGMTLS